jgi:hypothetical protein
MQLNPQFTDFRENFNEEIQIRALGDLHRAAWFAGISKQGLLSG